MASQELVAKRRAERKTEHVEDTATDTPEARANAQALLDETEAMLDEIDAVLEVEAPKPTTLADLIRWGSKENPQAIGSWTGAQGETCALEAALHGAKSRDLL